MVIEVSHSEVESFLICERRHFYSQGLKIRPKLVSQALYRGTLGHAALQTYYQAIIDGADKLEARAQAYGTVMELDKEVQTLDSVKIRVQLIELLAAYFEEYEDQDYRPIEIEKQIKIYLASDIVMPFTIDAIMVGKNGYAVVDHKFCWNFFNGNVLRILPQLVKYRAALKRAGFQAINHAEYNEVRYRKVQDKYQFRRTPLQVSSDRVERTLDEHIAVGERIGRRKQLPLEEWDARSLRAANKFSCEKCPFIDICATDLDSRSRDLLLQTEYESQPDRYANIALGDLDE